VIASTDEGHEEGHLGSALAILGGAVLGIAIEPRHLDGAARLLRREVAAMTASADRYGTLDEGGPAFDPSWT
jgi:hypothetical protein